MMVSAATIDVDLAVIGSGMAGMCAAFFAAERGLSTAQIGGPGQLPYAAGPWDLLAVHPIEEGKRWQNPWDALAALVADVPNHPYARIDREEIRAGLDDLLRAFRAIGLPYVHAEHENSEVLTSAGTVKPTYCMPTTMHRGVAVWRERRRCLVADVEGLVDFSARQICEALRPGWPDLRACRVALDGLGRTGELPTETLARELDRPSRRAELADALRPHLGDAEAVGLPAAIGYDGSVEAVAELEAALGVRVFEIPTPPISVPGLRLRNGFDRILRERAVRLVRPRRVAAARPSVQGGFELEVVATQDQAEPPVELVVRAACVILATGRFLGGGLASDRHRIRETLFDLPVWQPDERPQWHRREMFDPRGHPINSSGLETDELLRPLDGGGRPAHPALFAAGSILAHQDWMRSKSGSGLAIATARATVNAAERARPS